MPDKKRLRYIEQLGNVNWRLKPVPRRGAGGYSPGQQADGYGRKISMDYQARIDGKGPWYRVYCCIYSNIGTCYIIHRGEWAIVRDIPDSIRNK
jgi:hypothetical protein